MQYGEDEVFFLKEKKKQQTKQKTMATKKPQPNKNKLKKIQETLAKIRLCLKEK